MFGKLGWDAIPLHEPIALVTGLVVILVLAAIAGWITAKRWWPYLWHEYITSTDHKRIGIMYIVMGLVMLVRGFADAIMMRAQQSLAIGASQGYLPPEHYNQIFSAHGTIMIFFVAMPLVIGFMNFVVPLQLGVRDVAFPTMNNVSFWLTASGALLINASLIIGEFARTGWLGFPPLSEKAFSPGVGVDYYLVALQISGRRHGADRGQLRDHDPQDPRAGHELHAHADLLLDDARVQLDHPCRLSSPDRQLGAADARPLPRLSFLHE